MQRILYIDSIFFCNLVMDAMLLFLTAKTLKKTTTFLKILEGGLTGAAGYCLILCLPGGYLIKVLLGMLPIAALMMRAGCGIKGVKELLYGMGYFFTYSFFLGGFILFLIRKVPFFRERGDSLVFILLIGCGGFFLCRLGLQRRREEKKIHFCKIGLPGDQGEITVYGLIDTGNGLRDPVSGKEVAVLEERVWRQMQNCKKEEKYKLIPFHSIGKENGMLEGYEVSKIRIEEKPGERELQNVIIAVFNGKISANGNYQILLPPQWF